jgi:hypothetical protein
MVTTFSFTELKSPARHNLSIMVLPFLHEKTGATERDIYMAFIQSFRDAPYRRIEVRILTAILRAADVTDNSDAYIARVLVDMGLMAPRLALPGDFLDHVDATLNRQMPLHSVPASYKALAQHWAEIGDDGHIFNTEIKDTPRMQSFLLPV